MPVRASRARSSFAKSDTLKKSLSGVRPVIPPSHIRIWCDPIFSATGLSVLPALTFDLLRRGR
jgi:hypothetical protein